jgi:uncharacterized protein with ParB-like and HNH nuclease domain
MGNISNNIQADAKKLIELLDKKKYVVDYFQREYKWEFKHIEQLIIDLEASFNSNYQLVHTIDDITGYNSYYLGPIVICDIDSKRSIVDGQQRLTSITLLLIFLNNLQKDSSDPEEINDLIFSKKGSRKTYNIEVPDRTKILDVLYNDKLDDFIIDDENDESIKNMYERYNDIKNIFPENLKGSVLPLFIEWMKDKIVFVEILAYSDENAYTIFETMNDRGLNLTPTEMLKGFLLNHIKDADKVNEINIIWKEKISQFHYYSNQEDMEFFRAWLRGKYANSIRNTSKGAGNEDFEKIGTRFHTWVKENIKDIGLNNQDSFYYFIKGDFVFYSSIYGKIKKAERYYNEELENIYFSKYLGLASSLTYPLYISSINKLDDDITIDKKLALVSRFLDVLSITRTINGKSITQSNMRYYIYSLVPEIRNKNLEELSVILKNRLESNREQIFDIDNFRVYNNRKFVHYLLARCIFNIVKKKQIGDFDFDKLMIPRVYNRFVLSNLVDFQDSYLKYFENNDARLYETYISLGNHFLLTNPIANEFNEINDLSKTELFHRNPLSNLFMDIKLENENFNIVLGNYSFKNFEKDIKKRTESLNEIIKTMWTFN